MDESAQMIGLTRAFAAYTLGQPPDCVVHVIGGGNTVDNTFCSPMAPERVSYRVRFLLHARAQGCPLVRVPSLGTVDALTRTEPTMYSMVSPAPAVHIGCIELTVVRNGA